MNKLGKKVMNELYNREDRENFEGIKINDHKIQIQNYTNKLASSNQVSVF